MSDDGKCGICLQDSTGQAARVECGAREGHVFCHPCIKTVALDHRKRNGPDSDVPCPLCRRAIKGLRVVAPTERPVPEKGARWQYSARTNGNKWWDFTNEANATLERAWRAYKKGDRGNSVDIDEFNGLLMLRIDFETMQQTTRGTGGKRNVRRLAPLADEVSDAGDIEKHKQSKGRAGMPYDPTMSVPW